MNACPRNVSFTLAVWAAEGGRWGVAVVQLRDGSYSAEFCRVAKHREPGDELTCIDPRNVEVFGEARFVELTELPAIIEFWRNGKISSTRQLPTFPIKEPIPAFLDCPVSSSGRQWVRLTTDGTVAVPEQEFKLCVPL